ncbi:MAG: ABC transporter permease [Bacteroidota bacterium]|nr:ABC transporter permease [Bacteroidota bacterium]
MFLFGQSQSSLGKKLYRHKGLLLGIIIISIASLLSVFAYLITPDHSPNANRMIPEIGSKKPGFSIYFLLLPNANNSSKIYSISSFWEGKEDEFSYIPVDSAYEKGDSIIYQKYIDDHVSERKAILKKKLAQPFLLHKTFYLGTDKFGRDILSRLIIGTRVSLSVGCIAVFISLTIGILLGAIAGYFKGMADQMIMWLINVVWSIPTLLLVFAITLVLGKGFWQVFIAVGLTMWVNVARLVRGQVMAIRELEYIEATQVLGYSNTRTILKHILPNILGPVMVIAASNFASAIVIEAGLSFLGVGVQPPQPSWGLMIKENYNFIITHNPLLAIIPGIAIMLLVLAFNLVGNGLRDVLHVKN